MTRRPSLNERAPTQPPALALCCSARLRRLHPAARLLALLLALLSSFLVPAGHAQAQDTPTFLPFVAQAGASAEVLSPDGRIAARVRLSSPQTRSGAILYEVRYDGSPVLGSARLGLSTQELRSIGDDLPIDVGLRFSSEYEWFGSFQRAVNEQYTLKVAERSSITNRFNELTVVLRQKGSSPARLLHIVVRAYDEGVALRYVVPAQEGLASVTITEEHTRFALLDGQRGWQQVSPEAPYQELPASAIGASLPGGQTTIEAPLTLQGADGTVLSITEAAVENAPRMRLRRVGATTPVLSAALDSSIFAALPYAMPWRVIMIAPDAGQLYEQSYLMYNLSAPAQGENMEWLKPGTALRVAHLDLATAKNAIDFASAQGIEYIEFDVGWYSSIDENNPGNQANVPIDALGDIKSDIVAYGMSKTPPVGLILYVNYAALRTQSERLLVDYEDWGVSGLKVGFVDARTQSQINFLKQTVRDAAAYEIFVDIHDDYVPSGLTRTLPNLLTQEGIRGSEHFPGAEHDTILPFARFHIGAADYTIPYFGTAQTLNTSRAHQLALAVAFYSPLKFVFWYDFPWKFDQGPDTAFFGRVPTVWDETVVLAGEIGDLVSVARRSGDEWFVGTITDASAQELNLALDFLPAGRTYAAQILRDGATLIEVAVETQDVTSESVIPVKMIASGGHAIWLHPKD